MQNKKQGVSAPKGAQSSTTQKNKQLAKKPEDSEFETFLQQYRKDIVTFEVGKIAEVEGMISLIQQEGKPHPIWNFTKEFDFGSFAVLMHSLRLANYRGVSAIRVWKCKTGDEAVRSVCAYLDGGAPVADLQFLNINITALGCDILGKSLVRPTARTVSFLRLDHNKILSCGLQSLARHLCQNSSLRRLSLQYCGMDASAGPDIAHILIYVNSSLDDLNVKGNNLNNPGTLDVLKACAVAKQLRTLDLSDNNFSDTKEIISALCDLIANPEGIHSFYLSGNQIGEESAQQLVAAVKKSTHLKCFRLPEKSGKDALQAISHHISNNGISRLRKPRKRKKKGSP